jgi:hypothetical protein
MLSAISDFLMTGVGTTHLHKSCLKLGNTAKKMTRMVKRAFADNARQRTNFGCFFYPNIGKLLLKSVRAQVISLQVAQTQKEVQKVRNIVKHEVLLQRSMAG